MQRREFIALLGGMAVWPGAAHAQQSAIPVIGFVHTATAGPNRENTVAFSRGLKDAGLVEGQGVAVEYFWAEGHYNRLPDIMAELVRRKVALILAGGGTAPGEAAKAATTAIPIVFVTGDDPLRVGLVPSLNRPGGNVTGVLFFNSALAAKRVELLRELSADIRSVAYIVNPNSRNADQETKDARAAADKFGIDLHVLPVGTATDIDGKLESIAGFHAQAMMIASDPFLGSERVRLAALAARAKIPLIGSTRDYALAGGIISYSTSLLDAYQEAGVYAGRILKGEKPGDLPVTQPTRFELIVNVKAAEALGITVPPTLLARADEVIE